MNDLHVLGEVNPRGLKVRTNGNTFLKPGDIKAVLDYNPEVQDVFIEVERGDGIIHKLRATACYRTSDDKSIIIKSTLLV